MSDNSWSKIYFQLAPSVEARSYIADAVSQLQCESSQQLQLNDRDRWHLTVIHIGNLEPIWQQLRDSSCKFTLKQFKSAMSDWAHTQQQRVAGAEYSLTVTGFRRFGARASVLAIELGADSSLAADHQQAYQQLVEAWALLGINQPAMTMRSLPELKFAHELNPHVSVARGVNANATAPTLSRCQLSFAPMKFFYQLHE